jgi:hypothetical protein
MRIIAPDHHHACYLHLQDHISVNSYVIYKQKRAFVCYSHVPGLKSSDMLKEGFRASNETLNNPRQRDLPSLIKGN